MAMRIDKAMLRKALTRAGLPADKVKRFIELTDKQEKAEQESLKKREEDAEYRRQQQDTAKEEEPGVPEEGEGEPSEGEDEADPFEEYEKEHGIDLNKIPTADEVPDISDEELERIKEMDCVIGRHEFGGFGDDLDKKIDEDLDRMLSGNMTKDEMDKMLDEDAELGDKLVKELKRKLAEVDQDKV